ncbi:LysM peptidoglycan-binding domain-containing protein [Nocardioides sp. TF02-7]|uniref:LysM peptidoglycan-binding domain-containing protein n=1 Tax=Nocardioides sp. TF02-7 TaxID=2917724 RepID=UPI001F054BBE|nr:LysM peptidoglycan-binding domain-containing protein [Nocardioides sp. TF02-7]UMG91713.1 LysM peptidoglycan-binding domain-containing protein [Nocardioides sp. TF02-7]
MYVCSQPPARLRCCAVWVLVTGVAAALTTAAAAVVAAPLRGDRPVTFADLLTGAARPRPSSRRGGCGCSPPTWPCGSSSAVCRPLAPAGRGRCGRWSSSLAGPPPWGAPAAAATGPVPDERSPRTDPPARVGQELLAGLPLPDRATGGARRPAAPETHRVRTGDSLWTIAADRLDGAASAAEVTAYWQRVHAVNAAEIGPDPDLIHPGQQLVLPPPHQPQEHR